MGSLDQIKPNSISFARPAMALATLLLLLATTAPVTAQSTDRDHPTVLTSNMIKGTGAGKKAEYFYSFSAGPGDLILTIDLSATADATSAEIELFDSESKIFYYYPNATTQNEHAVKHLNVSGKQTLTLRIALDGNAGAYAIKLGGAVEFAQAESSQPPGPSQIDNSSASNTATSTSPATQAESGQSTPQTESDSGASVNKSSKASTLDLGLNILQAVGNRFALPTTGMLHILLKDGTTQDIDLSRVKSASIIKQ